MEKNIEVSVLQFLRIIDKIILIDKNNILIYGNELKLYPSEIHLILLIGSGQAMNFNTIVRKLGVTKGAVSQTISRLVKKGILMKNKDPIRNKDLVIFFTPLGDKVLKQCKKIQNKLFKQLSKYFISLPQKDHEIIKRFLTHIETNLSKVSINNQSF